MRLKIGHPGASQSVRLAALALALLVLPALLPAADAAEPGSIERVELSVNPRVQGIGGPVTATARVLVASDPHRNLFVNDLRVELTFGAGLTLAEGENPIVRSSVEIPPTVNLYAITFSWLLSTAAIGPENISVNVTTAAAGGGLNQSTVTVREGVVLGLMTLSPASPTTQTSLNFRLPVSSGFDDPDIPLNVTLFVHENPALVAPASANGSRLRLTSGEVVSGVRLKMDGDDGSYTYSIPPQPRGTLIYWVFVETPYNNVTSAPTRVFVADPGVSTAVSGGMLAAILAVIAVAVAFIILDPWSRRPALGSIHNSPSRIRLSLALFAVGAVVFTAAVAIGAVVGLWRWFGYT